MRARSWSISARVEGLVTRVADAVAARLDGRLVALEGRVARLKDQLHLAESAILVAQAERTRAILAALPPPIDTGAIVAAVGVKETLVAERLAAVVEAAVDAALVAPLPPRPRVRTYGPAGRAFTADERQP